MVVSEMAVKALTGDPPIVTAVACRKPWPVIVTVTPPIVGPVAGKIELTLGALSGLPIDTNWSAPLYTAVVDSPHGTFEATRSPSASQPYVMAPEAPLDPVSSPAALNVCVVPSSWVSSPAAS
jgi:hypothetical protein